MKKRLVKTVKVKATMQDKVYKIFTESEWRAFQETGQFGGSEDDRRDGFIHLCTQQQVTGVVERFFAGRRPLYVAEFSNPDFIERLKWEFSGSNGIYPHLYGFGLIVSDLSGVIKL